MKNLIRPFLITSSFLMSTAALADIHIKTKWDSFALNKSGGGYSISDKKIHSPHLEPLLTVLRTKATAPCPEGFQGQVTVTQSVGGKNKVSRINLDKGILKSSDGCLMISGPGLDAFPIHRKWLIGPFEKDLDPKKRMHFKGESMEFRALRENEEWDLNEHRPTFNYEQLESFARSLHDFKVDRFIHISRMEGKPSVTLTLDGKSHKAFQLAPTTWAIQDGPYPWAFISSQWSNWEELDQAYWTDSRAEQISTLLAAGSSKEQKLSTLKELGESWSESLKRAYQTCIKEDAMDSEVRGACLAKMKRRPTTSNFRAVVKMLDHTDDPNLLKQAGDFLRIKNPKGPKYTNKTEPSEFKSAWKSWWAKSHR